MLTDFGVNMFGSFIQEGGSWGDIYANKELLTNEKGQYLIDAQGRLKVQAMSKKWVIPIQTSPWDGITALITGVST
ncbi:hypothetical protein [Paraflavitalea speifideaquila]|uniref:hypothetical protein n=1 Tax=Paraflavitalea speifideaquila TaxID=3076558 RepID=UPI0028F10525|nr:hypothetical protein [Paraflavitalea speifideiaquila]